MACELVLEPLGPRPVARKRDRAAVRAGARHGLGMAAVVARDPAGHSMQHQRDVAVRAPPHPTARAARQEVRPPAPVEEDDRLLAPLAHAAQRIDRPLVERPRRLQRSDEVHGRQRPAVDPRGQQRALPPENALGTRCGAARHEHGAGLLPPALGNAPRVVARITLLLVRRVVLLVDHDQAEVGERREDGGARAHADARLAAAQPEPFIVALALSEAGVEDRHRVPEALLEAGGGLGR